MTSPPVIVLLTSGHPTAPAVLERLRANGVVVKAVVYQWLDLLPPRWKGARELGRGILCFKRRGG